MPKKIKTAGWRLKIVADRAGGTLEDAAIVQSAVNAVLAALNAKGFAVVAQEASTWSRRDDKDVPVLGTTPVADAAAAA